MKTDNQILKGGEFLVKETDPQTVFSPEDFSEEQQMIRQTCEDLIDREVLPNMERIEKMEDGLLSQLLDKTSEYGLMGVSAPEELGGFSHPYTSDILVTESIGTTGSFAVAFAAHTGIGTLPILYFGNEQQKKKYVPRLLGAELKACYCLTEPNAGSDPNSGKTKAVLSPDQAHYLINGQKIWITNAGIADIFIVFAKIDDDKDLSAFIVEKAFQGIQLGQEEHKMGLKGSSTRQIYFNDCPVPLENLLGERGGGFKIALNILNVGRLKLAAAALGAAKSVVDHCVSYANERSQFGRTLANYGAIKHKLADQVIQSYVLESAVYRCGHNIDVMQAHFEASGMSKQEAKMASIKDLAIEAAILKVAGSEYLDSIVDEGVQIFGGMGYSAESPIERMYRDSRINRIFEGTNEINRLLIIDMLVKRAMKQEIDLMAPAMAVAKELTSIPDFTAPSEAPLEKERALVKNLKKSVLMVAGLMVQKLGMKLKTEQEIMTNLADMIIDVYMSESVLLRVDKLIAKKGLEAAGSEIAIMKTCLYDATDRIYKAGKDALFSFTEGDELRMAQLGLKRFTKHDAYNVKEGKRMIADKLIAANKYFL